MQPTTVLAALTCAHLLAGCASEPVYAWNGVPIPRQMVTDACMAHVHGDPLASFTDAQIVVDEASHTLMGLYCHIYNFGSDTYMASSVNLAQSTPDTDRLRRYLLANQVSVPMLEIHP